MNILIVMSSHPAHFSQLWPTSDGSDKSLSLSPSSSERPKATPHMHRISYEQFASIIKTKCTLERRESLRAKSSKCVHTSARTILAESTAIQWISVVRNSDALAASRQPSAALSQFCNADTYQQLYSEKRK